MNTVNIDPASDFLNDLMLDNNISIKAIYDCGREHRETIENIRNIFNLKTKDDRKLCISLLAIMAGDQRERVIQYFREENNIDETLDEIFLKKNTSLLITALAYDTRFFAMAWNLCGFTIQALNSAVYVEEEDGEEEVSGINIFFASRLDHPFIYMTADPAHADLLTFDSFDVEAKFHDEDLSGSMSLMGHPDGRRFRIEFNLKQFKPLIPFHLEVELIIGKDEKKHVILLNDISNDWDHKKSLIRSGEYTDIDFTKGGSVHAI
jgi:hypothetical protein